jgi:ABC-type uncharacterized transport system substrate-binding protein
MRRREFIATVGGAVATWPGLARAQQNARHVGMLVEGTESTALLPRRLGAELQKLGWNEGRNLRLDVRFGAVDADLHRAHAAELVRLKPDVIVTAGSVATRAVQQQTRTIPIVFVVMSDPRMAGLVEGVIPEGNTTGIAGGFGFYSLGGRWVRLLKEAAPRIERVVDFYDARDPLFPKNDFSMAIQEAASSLDIEATWVPVSSAADIERAIDAFAAKPNGGLMFSTTVLAAYDREPLYRQLTAHRLPAMYPVREFVAEGGLMSCGANEGESVRRLSSYVDSILRGAKPGDLVVDFPTRSDLAINLKAAKAIGLEFPQTLISVADEVIG